MQKNMSITDRRIRGFVVAPVALVVAIGLGLGTVAGILLLVVAAVMAATSVAGFCPLYALVRRAQPTHH